MDFKQRTREIRRLTLTCIASLGVGHVGGSLSIAEALSVLYSIGIVRCADKTEIDLLLERAVDVAVEDPAPEIVLAFRLLLRLGSRRSRGQRSIPVTQRIAAAHTERILLRTGGE